jgi:hypothetical protein
MFFYAARFFGMKKIKTPDEIRLEIRNDYGNRSKAYLLAIIALIHLIRGLMSETFIFLVTLAGMLIIPFIFWLVNDNLFIFHLTILLCLPAHFYLYKTDLRELVEDDERIRLRNEMKTGLTELFVMLKERKSKAV